MELHHILLKYDQLDGNLFQELDAYNEINEYLNKQTEHLTNFQIAQIIALGFSENYDGLYGNWGTYFGPMYVAGGNESPSIELVNAEILGHWKVVLGLVNHPILIARYSGLIWDFTKYVTGEFPDIVYCIQNIKALISVSELLNAQNENSVFRKLARAINLSLYIKNEEFFNSSKEALINLENKVDKYDCTGLWGWAFDILIEKRNIFKILESDEIKIIDRLNFVFNHFCELGKQSVFDPFAAEHACIRLLIFYKRKNNQTAIFLLLGELKFLYLGHIKLNNTQIASGWLERLISLFKSFNVNKSLDHEISQLLILLKEVNKNSLSQFNKVEFSTTIEKSELDKIDFFVENITTGNPSEILMNISHHLIPDENTAKAEILNLSKGNHLRHLIGLVIVDSDGNRIAKIGPLKSDPEGHLISYLRDYLRFNYLLLRKTLDKLIVLGIGNLQIQTYLFDSGLIEDAKKPIFELAFDSYYKSNHLIFAHLIIPQIESLVRSIINKAGGNTMMYLENFGTFEEVSLEKALKDPIIESVLGKNLALYLKIIYIDKRGWNLRNRISHGLIKPETFNQMTSDYLLHTLLCFGLIRIK